MRRLIALLTVSAFLSPVAAGQESDLTLLLRGVNEIAAPGVPGPLVALSPETFVVFTAPADAGIHEPVVVAARADRGRVVAFGHTGYFGAAALAYGDTGALVRNAVEWASGCSNTRRDGRIVVCGLDDLAALLREAGWAVTTCRSLVKIDSLDDVDVVCVGSHGLRAGELDRLREHVRRGGGLITGGLGWGWLQLNPERTIQQHPGNQLLGAFGVLWADGTLKKTSGEGFKLRRDELEGAHAGHALQAVERCAAEPADARDEAQLAQAVGVVAHALRTAPPDDRFLRPRLASLRMSHPEPIVPSEKHPVTLKTPIARLLLTMELEELRRTPPEQLRAHPAAESFPGAPPADAATVRRTIEIDCRVPDWHSTGLYAPPGRLIRVELPASAVSVGLRVRIGAHKDRLWHKAAWKRCPEITVAAPLDAEEVSLANAFGGLIYVVVPRNAPAETTHVSIDGGIAAPHFVLGRTSRDEWLQRRLAPAPWAELESSKIIVTVPAELVRELDDPAAVMQTWDAIADADARLAGIPTKRARPERFVADRQISAGYMHAGYPIMTHLDAAAAMLSDEKLRAGNWGLFHELGHNHQSPDWTFGGTGEVTCNLFTLYVYETVCGQYETSRPQLFGDARVETIRKHLAAGAPFDAWKRDPFLALLMYMQLKEAFGWEAFQRVFAEYRDLPPGDRPRDDAEKRDQWLIRFSRAVGKNLGPFFEAWGVPTSPAAREQISTLPFWMPDDWAGE